ncbi:PREDICTED: ectonucleoside triphosphate diphosphohydrolase 6-like isoform X2 [Chinchilla lanigera]|uniref:ectonucleoside triphosphate diphosphohydrolase 6-like isoform X2 n=1 Tax=Chinchilla lanigera TaxID=34839 RepID=UPI000695E345|nr:PREDICTED: ectonucleoside triphosphate diphosphohydrolase 6-like isoform X2 [Chinchilla lanigera]
MRKIPNHGALRMTKVAYPLGLCVGLFIYVAYIKWHRASTPQALSSITGAAHLSAGSAARAHEVFYGIMFDAGSTGTRVHVFQFARPPGETPTLTHETFKALKPGLSAYADDVEKSAQGIQELLDVAKQDIPFDLWKATPLVLKATAGLRLLPGEKAQKLLQKVKEVFKASPFLVGDDCVSIMNGTDEGVSAWITVNFLTGSLRGPGRSSVGMLDLGGGSTQITFLPRAEGTLEASPPGHLTSLQMFNRTYRLYSHSYLGLGLMSARLAILGGVEGRPAKDGKELVSACLSPGFRGEWEHAEITYRISGQKGVSMSLVPAGCLKSSETRCTGQKRQDTWTSMPSPTTMTWRPVWVSSMRRREAASQSRTSRSQLSTCAGPWVPNRTAALSSAWTSPMSACCSASSASAGTKC